MQSPARHTLPKQRFAFLLLISLAALSAAGRDISFCGEAIPMSNDFVANKLMYVIRQQARTLNLPNLRREAQRYFPMIEYCLKKSNMPEDLKYIPIIESGFRNAASPKGAQGFWQLMEPTAKEWGLQVGNGVDERNDIYKATIAALRELARTYKFIRSKNGISSWVLTAAAYNWGIGNVHSKLQSGSNNYFSMNLNPETAVYVYKIVAIKELFEYPELYLKNFSYNVFNRNAPMLPDAPSTLTANDKQFRSLELNVKKEAGADPDDGQIQAIAKPTEAEIKSVAEQSFREAKLVGAQVVGKYRDFKDGDSVSIKLQDDLQTLQGFQRKGTVLTGKGWLVDNRVFVDLGFGSNNVILYDAKSEQGIGLGSLKNKEQLILRVQN